MGFEGPGGVGTGEVLTANAPASLHGMAGGETFEAIAMGETVAGEGIVREVVGDADVAHFGMGESVEELTVHHGSAADAGADGEVQEGIDAARSSPDVFAESGCVDVGIEEDALDAGGFAEELDDWDALPGELGSGGDGAAAEVDGAEAADAEGVDFEALQERNGLGEGFVRSGGGEFFADEFVRAGTDAADEFGTAGFDARQFSHGICQNTEVNYVLP